MASIKENNLELNYGWTYGESGWNSGMDENIVKLGFESRKRVNGILSSPPSSPSNGDAYIVGTAPTGLFSGKFANIAIYDRSSWIFIVPKNQEVVFNASNGCDYIYNNGWSLKLEEEVTPYIKVKDFTFSTGYTITDQRQCLLNITDNHYYQWNGTLPKVVPAGSTPSTAGGVGVGAWSDKTDLTFRDEVMNGELVTASMIKNSSGETVENKLISLGKLDFSIGLSLKNQFGAVEGSDITSALTAAINYSKLNGYSPIIIDLHTCSVTGVLPTLNNSFDFVPLKGLGRGKTVIDAQSAPDFWLNFYGGSGGSGGVVFEGLSLTCGLGNPILNKGFCGARVRDCYIDAAAAAVLSNDISDGTFTEFFLFDACELYVEKVFATVIGAGNDSFHGCGLTNRCIINEKDTATGGMFYMGASVDTKRTVWYNAPLDCQIFKKTENPVITTGSGQNNIFITNGNTTFENFSVAPITISSLPETTSHSHAGTFNSWNLGVVLGTTKIRNLFSTYPSGVVGGGILDCEIKETSIAATTIGTGIKDNGTRGRLVNVSITGANYEYCVLVYMAGRVSQSITPTAVIIGTSRDFNSAGWGAPTFSVDGDNQLVLTNTSYTGTIYVVATGMPCYL